MKKLLLLLLLPFAAGAQGIEGRWTGVIEGMGLALNIEVKNDNGGYTARLQSPYQSAQWHNADSVFVNSGELYFVHSALGAAYNGRLEGETIRGEFTQFGRSFPLGLVRGEIKRPQLPVDQPYRAEDVTFVNGDVTLAGILTTPARGTKRAVVLMSGSGAQNRNGEPMMGHMPFLVLADYLTRHGIAVLRYDDRGVGRSGGDYATSGLYDFAEDGKAAVEFLRARGFAEVGVAGHSQGGYQAMILAADTVPDFVVLMASPGLHGQDVIDTQRRDIFSAQGADEVFLEGYTKAMTAAEAIIFAGGERSVVLDKLRGLFAGTPFAGSEELTLAQLGSPEWQGFANFDPAEYYPRITSPVLAVGGGKDLVVAGETNLAAIKNGIPYATVKLYPGLNHLFQTAVTGLSSEYGMIDETFNERVMNDIAEWIGHIN